MRGRPVCQWWAAAGAWFLLAVPVALVSRSAGTGAPVDVPAEASTVHAWITVRFSSPPSAFSLRAGDDLLMEMQQPETTRFERTAPVRLDESGVEMVLEVATETRELAVEVILEPDALPPRSRTVWLSGNARETMVFEWERR